MSGLRSRYPSVLVVRIRRHARVRRAALADPKGPMDQETKRVVEHGVKVTNGPNGQGTNGPRNQRVNKPTDQSQRVTPRNTILHPEPFI